MSASAGPSLKARARPVLRLAIKAVILVTLYYFARAVSTHWTAIAAWEPGWTEAAVILGMISLYTVNLYVLAELWHQLAVGCQGQPLSRATTYPSFAHTQIFKYLPGNVFHFVGRHLYLTSTGATQGGLVQASGMEIAVMAVTAACISLLGAVLGLIPVLSQLLETTGLGWIFPTGGSLAALALLVAAHKLGVLPPMPPAATLWRSLGLTVLFFILQGVVFLLLARSISPEAGLNLMVIATLSWLIGYVTPGAPGGIGVREVVMLVLLRPEMPEAEALIVIGLFRLTTTLADVLLYVSGLLIWRRADLPD